MTAPRIFAAASFESAMALGSFEPLPWAIAMRGSRSALEGDLASAMRIGWNTGAVADGKLLYLAGIFPRRTWQDRCIEAEVWACPCEGWEQHWRFAFRHARSIRKFQIAKRIPRLVAYVLVEDAFGSSSDRSRSMLEALDFHCEGNHRAWWQGHDAWPMARVRTNFEPRNDLN